MSGPMSCRGAQEAQGMALMNGLRFWPCLPRGVVSCPSANRGHDHSFLLCRAGGPMWASSLPTLPLKAEMTAGERKNFTGVS